MGEVQQMEGILQGSSIDTKTDPYQQPQLVDIPGSTKKYNESISNINVLFYDPLSLQDNIPSRIFDEHGQVVDLRGQHVLLVPPDDSETELSKVEVPQSQLSIQLPVSSNSKQSIQSNLTNLRKNHPKDNMILFGTILTMAVFVGALTGKRIRKSCNFLQYFIESEGDQDEDVDDRESILMGRDYDTFGRYAGDMRWRGDLEKFDV